ncbi:hypothetical protein PR202_gb23229 [Eleusine coracana subsp. coracana]|uniref:Uncharacterized protein n=1 Tax=Eleusine coracana subsp. coracana TaxID=191504 RepID=A0AAV5FHP4_ELECO|nr:hypothetical protein PR202_gb23229 [Eleusine coracana subsp. coracana]
MSSIVALVVVVKRLFPTMLLKGFYGCGNLSFFLPIPIQNGGGRGRGSEVVAGAAELRATAEGTAPGGPGGPCGGGGALREAEGAELQTFETAGAGGRDRAASAELQARRFERRLASGQRGLVDSPAPLSRHTEDRP